MGCANALLPFLSSKASRNYFGAYESEAIAERRETEFQSCLAAARHLLGCALANLDESRLALACFTQAG